MTSADPPFEALLGYIKEARGFDFTGYKRASLQSTVEELETTNEELQSTNEEPAWPWSAA